MDKFGRNFFQSSKAAGYTVAILFASREDELLRRWRGGLGTRQSPRLSSRGVIKVRFPWDRVFSRDFRENGRENCRRKKAYPLALRSEEGVVRPSPVQATLKDRTHSFPSSTFVPYAVRSQLRPLDPLFPCPFLLQHGAQCSIGW